MCNGINGCRSVPLSEASVFLPMSQYAHYSETTPELAAVVSQLPSVPMLDDVNLVREGFKRLFANVGKAQSTLR